MGSSQQAPCDWQTSRRLIKERGRYILESGTWSDCSFIVGTKPAQEIFEGHKLILAMSSPVFEAMFYGGMAEKEPIAILDVQPEAFKALLEYIYTDRINLTSFDQACELCYGAKKYMLPYLVEECTKFLWSDLYPKNACRAFEFAKLFEEPILTEKCLHIICTRTQEVLAESSFEDIDMSTLLTVFDQNELAIHSELELFNALSRYANCNNSSSSPKVPRMDGAGGSLSNENNERHPTLRDALMKIRFLTLTPQEFAEGPATSILLTDSEKFSLLMNISSSTTNVAIPDGFSTSRLPRVTPRTSDQNTASLPQVSRLLMSIYPNAANSFRDDSGNDFLKKLYCVRIPLRLTDCHNTSVLDCSVTFTCDKNICVYGIQVPTQDAMENDGQSFLSVSSYTELLYAHLLDADGSRLTYTHFTSRVTCRTLIDICFNRPIYIQRNKAYKVGVVLHKAGHYPSGTYTPQTVSNGVVFSFVQDPSQPCVRDGLIRSIIFSYNPTNQGINHAIFAVPGPPS